MNACLSNKLYFLLAAWLLLPRETDTIRWIPYSDALLTQAQQAHQPVIIDFAAKWCVPCKELDRDTFSDPKVRQQAEKFLTLRADLTSYSSPEVRALRERYRILGVPTVVFIDKNGYEHRDLRVTGFIAAKDFQRKMTAAAE